jgi:hypothetical protein
VVYGEYWGPNSLAGIHVDPLDQMKLTIFDLLVIKKSYHEFLLPQEFVKLMAGTSIPTPRSALPSVAGKPPALAVGMNGVLFFSSVMKDTS